MSPPARSFEQMKRLLITLLLIGANSLAWAYDFRVPMQGFSLYYDIVDSAGHKVAVTAPRTTGTYRWNGYRAPSGTLELPATVEYEGVTYTLTAVAERAFAGCSKVKKVVLPESLVAIGDYAFSSCNALSSVVIPSGTERIGNNAFYRCANLRLVTSEPLTPPVLGTDAFGGISAVATLVVPCLGEERYRQADEWRKMRQIKRMEPCLLDIRTASNDPQMGVVVGGGSHTMGDTVALTAVCRAGYGFKGWSDGNTDNPRYVAVVDTMSCTALFQATEVKHEIEYVHDTIYKDGIETIYEYYEINDIAEPIDEQDEVVYNSEKRRIEVPIDKKEIVSVALYNDFGVCVSTGKPRRGHINMKRYPTGFYVVRITTEESEQAMRFLHVRKGE